MRLRACTGDLERGCVGDISQSGDQSTRHAREAVVALARRAAVMSAETVWTETSRSPADRPVSPPGLSGVGSEGERERGGSGGELETLAMPQKLHSAHAAPVLCNGCTIAQVDKDACCYRLDFMELVQAHHCQGRAGQRREGGHIVRHCRAYIFARADWTSVVTLARC